MPESTTSTAGTPAATGETSPAATTTVPAASAPPVKADEALGEGGKKALESEREARKQAEQEAASLRKDFETFQAKLSEAFGVKSATDGDDTLTQLQQQLSNMQKETAVYRLAAKHEITDEGDLELLKSATDEAAMTKLAERLAAAKASTPGTPKPDATQGGGKGAPPALNSDGLEQALKSKLGIT